MPTREEVFTALFARAQGMSWGTPTPRSWKSISRRVKLFSDVPTDQQPALYQAEHAENSVQLSNLPYKRVWKANWIIYQATAFQQNVAGAIENNIILDACQEALKPTVMDVGFGGKRCTLDGLVYHCFIDGDVFKDPGDIDNQAMMVVPISMLVP